MPYPHEYMVATEKFAAFLNDVKKEAGFGSSHMAYTMVQGVFQVFRRRVAFKDAIAFANVLPVGLRALFIDDWDVDEERLPFTDLETMNMEVRTLRPDHNFATDKAIQQVGAVLKKYVVEEKMRTVLMVVSQEAREFWEIQEE